MKFDFQTLIIPLASSLVGLIPFLINLAVNTVEKRSQKARMNSILQLVNHRVGFLTNWYNLQKEVADASQMQHIKSAVSEELDDVYELFVDVVLDPDEDTKQRKAVMTKYRNTSKLRRFLLLYTPYNTRGWFFHTLYYMCTLPLLAAVIYMIYSQIKFNDFSHGIPPENFIVAGITLVLVVIFRMMGREAAKDIEQRMVKVEQKTMPFKKIRA